MLLQFNLSFPKHLGTWVLREEHCEEAEEREWLFALEDSQKLSEEKLSTISGGCLITAWYSLFSLSGVLVSERSSEDVIRL